MTNNMNKISRLHECQCGWLHITQGPFSCWVCQEQLSFAKWQTGKEAADMPTKVVVHRMSDQRDRLRNQVTVVRGVVSKVDGCAEMGFPDEPGRGRYGKEVFYNNGHSAQGQVQVIRAKRKTR
jgi:hypothetical protein